MSVVLIGYYLLFIIIKSVKKYSGLLQYEEGFDIIAELKSLVEWPSV